MSQIFKIVRTDQELECPIIDKALRAQGHDLVLLPDNVDDETLLAETKDADLLLMCYRKISAELMAHATKLKGIVKYGVGIDAIDMDAALEYKIPVVNIPHYAEETVAEGAFAMMMALAKRLIPISDEVQTNDWAWPEQKWLAHDIAEKTVGLVGTGKIAASFARMAHHGFRAKVLGYDPNVDQETMAQMGVIKVNDLQTMLSQCDFVSVHAVLNDSSHHLIGADEFTAMKDTAFFINAGRGAIVDEMALLKAIQDEQIAGAGLDVFSQEPLNKTDHPLADLYGRDNVILFPHLTFYTHEAMERLEKETLERCDEILSGKPVLINSTDPRLMRQTHGVRFP